VHTPPARSRAAAALEQAREKAHEGAQTDVRYEVSGKISFDPNLSICTACG
jgi:hypothetical protein